MRCGADAVGLVSAMPSGPGVIAEEAIAEIAAQVPPSVATFLLTSLQDPEALIAQQRRCRADVLQLVDRQQPATYARLREALPGVRLVQVIHVADEASVEEALAAAPQVDALLLDSGNPALEIKKLGGTGRVHDWRLSLRIRDAVEVPVFLAGGLTPENVAEAVRQVRPCGVDVCSGVRTGGRLDAAKLRRFVAVLQSVSSA